jgi:phage shock protein C
MNQSIKRIYRSRVEGQLAGVCAGLGLYLSIDPVVVRLIAVAGTLATGVVPGVLAYVAAWVIMPLEPAPAPTRQPTEPAQQGSV